MKYDEPKLNLLTDHIGMFERSVPTQRWQAIAIVMLGLIAVATGAWELKMRSLGLRTADIDDGKAYWAVERRKVDSGPRDQVVIVGDSRIYFDTNLQVWQQVSGIKPIQLALIGTPAKPFLHDLAEDKHFAGLVVAGISEGLYFADVPGYMGSTLAFARSQSPSQRFGHQLQLLIEPYFAFLDSYYSLFTLLNTQNIQNRPGVEPGYAMGGLDYPTPWKLSENFADRQKVMWPRIVTDPYLNAHARLSWSNQIEFVMKLTNDGPLPAALIQRFVDATRRDVEKIRSRGGDVVFIRPPSSGPYLDAEKIWVPREQVWDALIRDTGSFGIYFDDYPDMHNLELPEWSHLNGEDAKKFTHAYVTVLCAQLPWLKQHGARCEDQPAFVQTHVNNRRGS